VIKDVLLEAVERRRRKSTLGLFFESPLRTIEERRYLLYVISATIALAAAAAAYYLGVDPSNIGIIAFILIILPPGFFNLYYTSRIRKLEAEFPALIRDMALSMKSGMTLKGAIAIAAGGEYGALTPAIRHVDNMMSWGVSFEEALLYFAKKYPTTLIRRTVSTIIEASRAGGEIGEIMESVAMDVAETKTLETRRSTETKPYLIICYLSFFVFLVVILVISHYFLPMMMEAAKAAAGKSLPGGMGQFAVSEADVALYKRLFFHALLIQGFFAGIISGKIGEGTAVAGLKHSVVFIVVAFVAYSLLI
jgi:flagellar protein FlaJ